MSKDNEELRPELFMDSKEIHGELKQIYYIQNKNNKDLVALTPTNTGELLPVVFKTKEDANFYLSYIDEYQKKDAIILYSEISFFDKGAILLTPKEVKEDNNKIMYYFIKNSLIPKSITINNDVKNVYVDEIGKVYSSDEFDFEVYDSIEQIPKFSYPSMLFKVNVLGKLQEKESGKYTNKIKLLKNITSEDANKYCEKYKKQMIQSSNIQIRINAAGRGFGLDILILDKEPGVRAAVAEQRYGLDNLINDPDPYVRAEVARQGYGLDKLINDPNQYVRAEVAIQGYGLDKLVEDKSMYVREEVANNADEDIVLKLVNDESADVKRVVAERGFGLNIFVKDPDPYVRAEVANNGKYITELLQDPNPIVRKAAIKYAVYSGLNDLDKDVVKFTKELLN